MLKKRWTIVGCCALLMLTSGCAAILGGNKLGGTKSEAPEEMTAEQRKKLEEMGGDELVTDVERFMDIEKDVEGEYQSTQCIRAYLKGTKKEQSDEEFSLGQIQSDFRSCEVMCNRAVELNLEKDLTEKYKQRCGEKVAFYKGSKHLVRFERELAEYEATEGTFRIYRERSSVAGALSQAGEALGEDHEQVIAAKEKLAEVDEKHSEALEGVRTFRARPEVQKIEGERDDLEAKIQTLDGQISEIEQKIEIYRDAENREMVSALQDQRRGKEKLRGPLKQRLDEVYDKWRAEAQKAGLIPSS